MKLRFNGTEIKSNNIEIKIMAKKTHPDVSKLVDVRDIQINDNVKFVDTRGLRQEILDFVNSKESHKIINVHSPKTEPVYYIENCPYLEKNQPYPFMHTRVIKYVQQ